MSWKGQEEPGAPPYYTQPLFSKEDGNLSSRFIPQHVIGFNVDQSLHPELPLLTAKQKEAIEYVQKLANDLDQSCHLTVYNQGKQVVISKVDAPSGMGFSVRVGAELDVLVSASGRTLLAFQAAETRKLRIEESTRRRPEQADPQIHVILDAIKSRGFESIPSAQVRGLYAVAYPVLDSEGCAIAALTVPYAERIDQIHRKSIAKIEEILGAAAHSLTSRLGGKSPHSSRSKAR